MGIGIYNGIEFGYMLTQTETKCRKCKEEFNFQTGADECRAAGITDNLMMCPKCHHVFKFELVPGKLTLTEDVTNQYPQAEEAARASEASQHQSFFKKLFGKK